jgi:queuine tRNA-ribosyltransferase
MFTLQHTDPNSKARAGLLTTDHGTIETPIFMPVGTQGTVKAIEQRELVELGAQIILGNTYHLYLRPSEEVLSQMGGLHQFMNWQRPILTDSGGFQIFSLKDRMTLSEDGAAFSSHIDGSKHFFSPERVMEIQRCIGSDIMMLLDECTSYPATPGEAKASMERSMRWARRCKTAVESTEARYGARQFAFGIGQGSTYKDLRRESLETLTDIGFDGYAIGGLAVGEKAEIMYEIVDFSTDFMPREQPRYLMGVGTPQNILECIERGVDMFDCVMPTRNARNAQLFTTTGRINLRNAKFRMDDTPLDAGLEAYASSQFSRGYVRHLFIADEILALQLASQQNIAFYLWLVRMARARILDGTFVAWKRAFLEEHYKTPISTSV